MSATAAARFRRIVTVLPRLASGERVNVTELAVAAGVERDELIRDLQALAERYDLPAAFVEGVTVVIEGGTVQVRSEHFCRPMRLTAAELCALELGLSLLARERDPAQAAQVETLRAALTDLIIELPRDAVFSGLRDGAMMDGASSEVLPAIRRSIRSSEVLAITYQGGSSSVASARDVRPYTLVFSRGSWFLVGWCEKSDAVRMFRTDRITAPAATGRTFTRPIDFSLDDLMVDGKPFVTPSEPATMTVRYGLAIARWIAERDRMPLEPDGSALRTMPLADREWAIRHVLQYGPDAEIVEPKDLMDEVADRLARIIAG